VSPWFRIDSGDVDNIAHVGAVAWTVYTILRRHASEAGECWPSIARLAHLAGVTERSTRTAIKRLSAADMVSIEKRQGRNGTMTNLYRLPVIGSPDDGRNETLSPGDPGEEGAERNDTGGRKKATGEGRNEAPEELDLLGTKPTEVDPRNKCGKATVVVEIPPELDTAEFRAAWNDWLAHRREIRKPAGPTAQRKALAGMVKLGIQRAIAAIEHSVARGWLGIFEPGESRNANGHHRGRAIGPGQRHPDDERSEVGTF
jgi:hypothetical protein